MIAVVTCAHVSLYERLRQRHNRILCDIYKYRRIRRAQYIECLDAVAPLRGHFTKLYLLECFARRVPRYLRRYPWLECAAGANRADSHNKGIKEFVNIADLLRELAVSDDERVFKLTGRYILSDYGFQDYCSRSSADVVAKRDDDCWQTSGKGVHTFMFASKAGVIASFADWLLEGDRRFTIGTTPIEWVFLEYMTNKGISIDFFEGRMSIKVNYAPPNEPKFV